MPKTIMFIWSAGLLLSNAVFSQTPFTDINEEIRDGNFTAAQHLISERIAERTMPEDLVFNLLFQSALLDRIRLDFSRDEDYVRKALSSYYPDVSDYMLESWEASNDLEAKMIDGEKRYFRNAVPNLFRVNEEARQKKIEVDGIRESSLDRFLQSYLPGITNAVKLKGTTLVQPKKIRINYTITVDPNAVPEGEIVRAWLPFPRSDRARLTSVQLISASEPDYIVSPETYSHKTIYMEKTARQDQPTVFEMTATYEAFNEWIDIDRAEIKPYDSRSEVYQNYTTERSPHIVFTPEIVALSREIVGEEIDPVVVARLIYEWIGEHIPWASAREYSTIPNIPMYCVNHRYGDCGIKALLFITLCRYNGIPAKWQSGWFLYPDNLNLHDWSEIYFEGIGWIPVDPDFNQQDIDDEDARSFFFGGADAYRLIVNDDFSRPFFPAKIYPRSETVDFQRGEVEWRGGNLYFNRWDYHMAVDYPE